MYIRILILKSRALTAITQRIERDDKYPLGIIAQRPRQITPPKYFNQKILDVDGRFAKGIEYVFVTQYTVEAKQVMDDTNNFLFRQGHTDNATIGPQSRTMHLSL